VELRYTVADPAELGLVQAGEPRVDAAVAALVSESLSDPLARVRGLGGRGPFDLGFPVAVKTGTSSGYRDGWCVGYTAERTVAVWVGNADGRPTAELSGAEGAGPLFVDVMRRAMRGHRSRAPLWEPALLEQRAVCPLSGKPVGPACPAAVTRSFPRPPVGAPAAAADLCELHQHASHAGGWRCDPHGTSAVVLLPDEFADWLAAQPEGAPGRDPAGLPWLLGAAVPGCSAERASSAALQIDEPADGSVVLLSRRAGARPSETVTVRTSMASGHRAPPGGVEILLDGQVVARSAVAEPSTIEVGRGDHELTARPVDGALSVAVGVSRFSVR
jgi:penicillin-binding protein 1C